MSSELNRETHTRRSSWRHLRRLAFVVAMASVSVLGALGPGVASVQAANPGDPPMLAGRPISGSTATGCQGTFYGTAEGVNGIVLYTAGHCRPEGGGGDIYYTDPVTQDQSLLGRFGPSTGAIGDLSYVILEPDMVPATLNQVYRGEGQYWTLTQQPTLDCGNVSSRIGDGVAQNFQLLSTSEAPARFGALTYIDDYPIAGDDCLVTTTIPWHGDTTKDSGSSFVLTSEPGTVSGVAHIMIVDEQFLGNPAYEQRFDPVRNVSGGVVLSFKPVAEGLAVLGGTMCVTADCSFPAPVPGAPTITEASPMLHADGDTLWFNTGNATGTSFGVGVAPSAAAGVQSVIFPAISGLANAPYTLVGAPYQTPPDHYAFSSSGAGLAGTYTITVNDTLGTSSTADLIIASDATAPTAPTVTLSSGSAYGWQDAASVTVNASGSTDVGSGLAGYAWTMTGAQTDSGTMAANGTGAPVVSAQGATTVTFVALDNVGRSSPAASALVLLDEGLDGDVSGSTGGPVEKNWSILVAGGASNTNTYQEDVTIDAAGNIWTVGWNEENSVKQAKVKKYSPTGAHLATIPIGPAGTTSPNYGWGTDIEASGDGIFVAGQTGSTSWIAYIIGVGEQWRIPVTGSINDLSAGPDGDVFTTTRQTSGNNNLMRITETGSIAWTTPDIGTGSTPVVDGAPDGSVYVSRSVGTSAVLTRYTGAGAQMWSKTISSADYVTATAVDQSDGSVYMALTRGSRFPAPGNRVDYFVRLDPDGNILMTSAPINAITGITGTNYGGVSDMVARDGLVSITGNGNAPTLGSPNTATANPFVVTYGYDGIYLGGTGWGTPDDWGAVVAAIDAGPGGELAVAGWAAGTPFDGMGWALLDSEGNETEAGFVTRLTVTATAPGDFVGTTAAPGAAGSYDVGANSGDFNHPALGFQVGDGNTTVLAGNSLVFKALVGGTTYICGFDFATDAPIEFDPAAAGVVDGCRASSLPLGSFVAKGTAVYVTYQLPAGDWAFGRLNENGSFDPMSPLATFEPGVEPIHYATGAGDDLFFAAPDGDDTDTMYRYTTAGTLVASYDLPGVADHYWGAPSSVAVFGNRVWIQDDGGSLTRFDTTGAVIESEVNPLGSGFDPYDYAGVANVGGQLWVGYNDYNASTSSLEVGHVLRVDPVTGVLLGDTNDMGKAAPKSAWSYSDFGVLIALPNGKLALNGDGWLAIVDPSTGLVTNTLVDDRTWRGDIFALTNSDILFMDRVSLSGNTGDYVARVRSAYVFEAESPGPPPAGPTIGLTITTFIPPALCVGDCEPFIGVGVDSTPTGWVIDDTTGTAQTSVFAAPAGTAISLSGDWSLVGRYADLQLCYSDGTTSQCDSAPAANARLGSHDVGAPIITTGTQSYFISGTVPAGFTGVYMTWSVGSESTIESMTLTIGAQSGQTTLDVDASITLTGIPGTIDFGAGIPGETVAAPTFTASVLTNNSAGYVLVVTTSNLSSAAGTPIETVSANTVSYDVMALGGGSAVGGPVVDATTPLTLSNSGAPSASGGDDYAIDATLVIPFVRSAPYTGNAAFEASTI